MTPKQLEKSIKIKQKERIQEIDFEYNYELYKCVDKIFSLMVSDGQLAGGSTIKLNFIEEIDIEQFIQDLKVLLELKDWIVKNSKIEHTNTLIGEKWLPGVLKYRYGILYEYSITVELTPAPKIPFGWKYIKRKLKRLYYFL